MVEPICKNRLDRQNMDFQHRKKERRYASCEIVHK